MATAENSTHAGRAQEERISNNPSLLHNCLCSKISILMVSDSLESSTKMPMRQKGRYLPLTSFVLTSNSRARRALGWLFGCMTPPGPGIHSHCTYYPELFLALIYIQDPVFFFAKSHRVSCSLASFPPLSLSFHQPSLSPAQQVNPARGSEGGEQAGRLQWSLSAELKREIGVAKRALLLKGAFVSLRKGRSFHFHFPQTTDLSDSVKASPMSAALNNRKASCQS